MIDTDRGKRQARTRSWMSGGEFLGEPPLVNPLDRGQVPAADSYQPGDAVWVFRHGVRNQGTVRSSSRVAVLVDYHRPGGGGVLSAQCPAVATPRLPVARSSTLNPVVHLSTALVLCVEFKRAPPRMWPS